MEHDGADGLDPLTEQALAWLVRLHSGDETEADWNAYHDWKASAPAHGEAASRAEKMWSRIGPALKPRSTGRNVSSVIVLAVTVAGAAAYMGAFGPISGWLADEATGIGERRSVVLADGSSIMLDAATSFDIEFSQQERRIVLRDGQVFVTVKPDPSRRFVAEARGAAVQALGTAFNVRIADNDVRVAVTEHTVRVSSGAAAGVDVTQGNGIDYTREGQLGTPVRVDTDSATAWTHGELIFDGRPLGDVVRDIGRYQRGTVVFTDASLRDLTVTGVFNTADNAAFFDALEHALPVRVTRLPLLTVISAR
jgi:transmembrane sensor